MYRVSVDIFYKAVGVWNTGYRPRPSAVVVFLFMAGLWFTGAIINGPNFHPKLTLAAPTIYRPSIGVSCCVSC